MNTWKTYYVAREHRIDQLNQAEQYRLAQAASGVCESRLTKLSIRILDIVGSKLVQWGSQLQCRCAELSLSSSERAI